MTLTAVGLQAKIKQKQGNSQDQTLQDDANKDLAEAIIEYLVANTLVTVNPDTGVGTIS